MIAMTTNSSIRVNPDRARDWRRIVRIVVFIRHAPE
jgi:hypothetical protein